MIELIKHAIKLNSMNYEMKQRQSTMMHQVAYAMDFKTIHLNVGRRTGKSTAMMTLARKSDLIVVHNEEVKRRLKHEYPHCLATINSIHDVVLGSVGLRGNIPARTFDYVWIDEPNLCDYDINLIYEHTRATLYIKLGE